MTVTTTGDRELLEAGRRAAARLEAELRAAAVKTAHRVRAGAQQRVAERTGRTKRAIEVVERDGQVLVQVNDSAGMVPVYLEFGTLKMPARPFMLPAFDAERGSAARDAEAANDRALRDL